VRGYRALVVAALDPVWCRILPLLGINYPFGIIAAFEALPSGIQRTTASRADVLSDKIALVSGDGLILTHATTFLSSRSGDSCYTAAETISAAIS
jgi:hypothetical protein